MLITRSYNSFLSQSSTAEHSEQDEVKRILDAFNPQNIMSRYIYEILRDFEDPMSIRVLVMGKVGVGKSTLVNALIGGDSVLNVTRQLEEKRVIKNGILINICDTPGLAHLHLEDDDTVQNARGECGEINLFLFCITMTDRIGRVDIEEIKAITRIFGGIDIWKKAMFVLTFANTYKLNEKEQFVEKIEEWTQVLREIISKIIGPELGNKVPVIPAGHTAPELPDRASWISELWIQGFRRMGFRAMVKLYIINQKRLHSTTEEIKSSQELYKTPEEQPLIACYMTTEDAYMSEIEMCIAGSIIGGIVGGAIVLPGDAAIIINGLFWGVILGNWATAKMLEYFSWNNEEEIIVNCHEETIFNSLILAFYEEYPEYGTYQAVKDELDFDNKNETATNEKL